MLFSSVFTQILSFIGAFIAMMFALLTSFAVIFAAITTWYGFKYRRDTNLNLRKDTHISIAETFDKFIKNLDNRDVINQEYYDLKLLGFFNSPLVVKRKGLKLNFSKSNTRLRNLLIREFKNWESIDGDFYIKRNHSY